MSVERPDLSQVDPAVRAYVEALEDELDRLRSRGAGEMQVEEAATAAEPAEPPTAVNVITLSAGGLIKRTPRHLYSRQRRGGMGVFDLECPDDDRAALLTVAHEDQHVILITNLARAFRLAARDVAESPVRGRGRPLGAALGLQRDERVSVALPAQEAGYLAVLSWRGYVRCLLHNVFGQSMSPGTAVYKAKEFGAPIAACWTTGDSDLFVATRRGMAIRFNERSVPIAGCSGIRLGADDAAAAIAAVPPTQAGGVFLLSADGRGTTRLMDGFGANKSPGGGGKQAMKADQLAGALAVDQTDDLFVLSRLSKIIRFHAAEVPAKEGVVQGVSCIALRADDAVAVAVSRTV